MKIKMSEVDKMIKEEFQKMIGKRKLSARLSQINEELSKMDSDDTVVNEVEAGEKTHVSSHAWTGEENGDVKWEPKFEKKGSALKEDGMSDEEVETPAMDDEMGADTEMEIEMGEFESKFAEIGKAIDAKLSSEAAPADTEVETPDEEMGAGDTEEDFEEVEVEAEPEMGSEEEVEEIDEYKEIVGGKGQEQGMTADETVKESVEEPLEGHSVAQEVAADDVNDNMEKDTHVKEGADKKGAVITEAKSTESKNIFTEGLDVKKKTALLEEMNRMKKFAGLSKDEE